MADRGVHLSPAFPLERHAQQRADAHLERYWTDADPTYCDGDGAESFGTLLRRAEAALARLAALPSPDLAYVFSHGQFIQAVRAVVTESNLDVLIFAET